MKTNKQINYLKFLHSCKQIMQQSLLFQAIRISAIIFLLMGGIFAIAPHVAYMTSQQRSRNIAITDSRLDFLSFTSSGIEFRDFSELWISLGHGKTFRIGDTQYDDSYRFSICADSKENKCIFSSALLDPPIVCSAMNVGIQDTRQTFTINNGVTSIVGMDDYCFLGIAEGNASVTILPFAGVKVYQGDKLIECFSEAESDEIIVDDCFGMEIRSNGNRLKAYGCGKLEAQFSEIKEFMTLGEGTLQFDYSQETKGMNVSNQEITGKGNLSAKLNLEGEEYVLDLSGIVKEATFSGLDLFPSFFCWYRNSVFIIPTTIVTVVMGAISLIDKNDKHDRS